MFSYGKRPLGGKWRSWERLNFWDSLRAGFGLVAKSLFASAFHLCSDDKSSSVPLQELGRINTLEACETLNVIEIGAG